MENEIFADSDFGQDRAAVPVTVQFTQAELDVLFTALGLYDGKLETVGKRVAEVHGDPAAVASRRNLTGALLARLRGQYELAFVEPSGDTDMPDLFSADDTETITDTDEPEPWEELP